MANVSSHIGGRTKVRPYNVVCNLRIVMRVVFAAMFLMFLYGEVLYGRTLVRPDFRRRHLKLDVYRRFGRCNDRESTEKKQKKRQKMRNVLFLKRKSITFAS
ncbi:MAG: hypothetical protein J6B33_04930 [Prevotella sp.]|nr:hypothetical protein [Prevotella sp.]